MKIGEVLKESNQEFEHLLLNQGFVKQGGGGVGGGVTYAHKSGQTVVVQIHPTGGHLLWWKVVNKDGRELAKGKSPEEFKRAFGIRESAMGGSTSAGSIASVANPLRPESIARRPSLFGYVAPQKKKKKKKKK